MLGSVRGMLGNRHVYCDYDMLSLMGNRESYFNLWHFYIKSILTLRDIII